MKIFVCSVGKAKIGTGSFWHIRIELKRKAQRQTNPISNSYGIKTLEVVVLAGEFSDIWIMDHSTNNKESQYSLKASIIIVMGLPGSGKSYFASRLAKAIHATYLASDVIRKNQSPRSRYDVGSKRQVYQHMAKMAENAIASNQMVVVDATFHLREFRDIFISLSQKHSCRIFWIVVEADEPLIKQRVQRPRKESDADYGVYQVLKEEYEPLEQHHLKLSSTDNNLDEMLGKAMGYLQMKHGKS